MFKNSYFIIILMCTVLSYMAQTNDALLPTITLQPLENNLITISGICANNTAQQQQLKYSLSIQKRSLNGNTNNNKQSGDFNLEPGNKKTLSTTTINFEPQDYTEITLTIFDTDNTQLTQQRRLLTQQDLLRN